MRNRSFTYEEAAFSALADPTRRAVLDLLLRGKLPAGGIARAFPVSRPAISKHLRVLRRAGLVRMERAGRQRVFELNPGPLKDIDLWLSRYRTFWENELSNLKHFVEAEQRKRAQKEGPFEAQAKQAPPLQPGLQPAQREEGEKKDMGGQHGSHTTNTKRGRDRQ